jgi:3-hydroxyisobutyrate dehydrogenase-like beta-hydroxyacid dehydrogenase
VVQGYGVVPNTSERASQIEGNFFPAKSFVEAVRGTQVVIISVQSAVQVDDVLFGPEEVVENLSDNAVIIISSSVPPSYIKTLPGRLGRLRSDISILDAPVCDWATDTANGTLNVR